MLTILIVLITIFIDVIVKLVITNNFVLNESIEVISNFFYITYTNNDGVAWSLLSGKNYIAIIVAILVIIYLIYYLKVNYKKIKKYDIIGYSLLLGGTIGNLVDRLLYGYVIDYLDFYIFNYNFPIFNIADMCIVIGIFIIVLGSDKK